MKGYAHMWDKARVAAGFALASADPSQDVTGSIAARATARNKPERIPLPLPRRPIPGI